MDTPTVIYNGELEPVPLRAVCGTVRKELRAATKLLAAEWNAIDASNPELLTKIRAIDKHSNVAKVRQQLFLLEQMENSRNSSWSADQIFGAVQILVTQTDAELLAEAQKPIGDEPLLELTPDEEQEKESIGESKLVAQDAWEYRQARACIDIKQVKDESLKALLQSTQLVNDKCTNGHVDVSTEFWQAQDLSEGGWPSVVAKFR